eukprot:2699489-Rhodomonas_salina.1
MHSLVTGVEWHQLLRLAPSPRGRFYLISCRSTTLPRRIADFTCPPEARCGAIKAFKPALAAARPVLEPFSRALRHHCKTPPQIKFVSRTLCTSKQALCL